MVDDPRNIEGILAEINSNMPVNRRTLLDYLENGDYTYRTRSGVTGSFGPEGIEYLDSICTEAEKMTLRLPIFISTDVMSESGAWKVDGRTKAKVIAKILGKTMHRDDQIQIYYPDLVELKKKIPDLTVILFLP
ncbi:MAG: DUF61 family protein [Candidatus Methanomethylophilaceae archaeon]